MLSQLLALGTKKTRPLPPRQHMRPRGQRQDGREVLLAKPSPLEEKKPMGMRGSWCDSDGRWDVLTLSRAGPGLQCQFSYSLCVTAQEHLWDVTPTTCCHFLPPAGLPFSSARLSWCQWLRQVAAPLGERKIVPLGQKLAQHSWVQFWICHFGSCHF